VYLIEKSKINTATSTEQHPLHSINKSEPKLHNYHLYVVQFTYLTYIAG